jgi:hypothetical protein
VHGVRKRKPPTGAAAFSAQDYLISVAEGKQAAGFVLPQLPARKRKAPVGRER